MSKDVITNSEKLRKITIERVEKFLSKDAWTDINLFSKLYKSRSQDAVKLQVYSVPDTDPNYTDKCKLKDVLGQTFVSAHVGQAFGPSWSTHWFKVDLTIPPEWEGETVHFIWDSESEAAVWADGMPVQAFNGSRGDDRRTDYVLSTSAPKGGQTMSFFVEMACCGMFGNAGPAGFLAPPDNKKSFTLKIAEIAIVDKEAWDLFYDLNTIIDIAKELPDTDHRGWLAVEAARQIVNACHTDNRSTWAQASAIAKDFLSKRSGERSHEISAVGHCHIDTAWLWPYSETRRKVARSWSTQCTIMSYYPEHKFTASQAAQFEWMKTLYPPLYERIKTFAAKGQFLPVGGTWIEMDCNIPSGESFVRQFLYGQRFFKAEFGQHAQVFWLPDTFGYSSQLPQIMRQAGIEYFLTQKLSWNLINKFPHSTFVWEGLNGDRVLAHFPPADTYCSKADVKDIVYGTKNFKTKDKSNESMLLFGFGDGGGGPTPQMLEALRRVTTGVDGLPKVSIRGPTEFFDRVKAASKTTELPLWVGELYFELHRGTYTTHARNKLGNRKSEFLLGNLEILAVMAGSYPHEELERLWKLTLLNQFHDVLPGTSIGLVYRDSAVHYKDIQESAMKLTQKALDSLVGPEPEVAARSKTHVAVANTLSWNRQAVVELPDGVQSSQTSVSSGKPLGLIYASGMSANSSAVVHSATTPVSLVQNASGITLENAVLRAQFDASGKLVSVYNKRVDREAIEAGKEANKFLLYDDVPFFWDAWDVEIYHTEKPCTMAGLVSIKPFDKGPLRASVELHFKISEHSSIKQIISLDAESDQLVFDTTVDWHENRKFLKVEFPMDVYSTQAAFSTQFGWQTRPTHRNTSWDMAKFEVCAHHWADINECGFGVALLNDSKYGYSCLGNVLTLSLLRSSKMPDETADVGMQHFKYALLPHAGSHVDANLVRRGYEFNQPLLVRATAATPPTSTLDNFFSVDKHSIVLETVKLPENKAESSSVIVRLWDGLGGRGTVRVHSKKAFSKAFLCNLMEENESELKVEQLGTGGCSVAVAFKPFQVITIKFV